MGDDKRFIFKINAYTPKTMPMARLAEYMAELATLLGEKQSIHFEELVPASTGIQYVIEHEAEPKVRERIRLVHNNDGPTDALNAFKAINKKLKEDNGDAIIKDGSAEIIAFPGINEPVIPIFGPVTESGTIDGVVIRIGGKNQTVTVTLETREGLEANCRAKRPLAKELGPHIFGPEMRFSGIGKWTRNEDGIWVMESFTITDYKVLDEQSLTETIDDLRSVEGSGWSKISDPWKELENIRGDD
ncbi:MAG: hypothetical protein OEY94_07935 [Alphaproteobacteria bacterium]|nr:hypothetical protein [Alphaproteobacteria bacterium]